VSDIRATVFPPPRFLLASRQNGRLDRKILFTRLFQDSPGNNGNFAD